MCSSKNIKLILKEVEHWMTLPGVEGIGEGSDKGKTCIIVFISEEPATLKGKIPSVYKNYPVLLQETGKFQIQ